MIDAHVHLDKGELSLQWIQQFVNKAVEMNIDELYLLEHTNLFLEFMPIYEELESYNEYQRKWVENKRNNAVPLSDYINFIKEIKKIELPIKIKYGLVICYSPLYEEYLRNTLSHFSFDFYLGSIHTIDGWAFSHLKQKWSEKDVDADVIYKKYYEVMLKLIESRLFNGLAHPFSLGCYGVSPKADFTHEYEKIAVSLYKNNMYTELNSGLTLNYGVRNFGMNEPMFKKLKENNVKILTSSDAHKPEHVGAYVSEMTKLIYGDKNGSK